MSYTDFNSQENVSEKLPTPAEYLVIPANDYGDPSRKRFSSLKFQILTRGKDVNFIPVLDGVPYAPAIFNTITKREVEYYFLQDTIAIDIGGILVSLQSTPFEFYGTIIPEKVEQLPPQLEYYRIPNSNFGAATFKRVRTIPMVLDTMGFNVMFTPIIDNIESTENTIFNTQGKVTVYYFFRDDALNGIDFGGELVSIEDPPHVFEFYEMMQPEIVESLPVPKIYDQLGPIRFDKIGKIFGFRVRLLVPGNDPNDSMLKYTLYGDNDVTYPAYNQIQFEGTIPTFPGIDYMYEVQFPKSVNTTMMRLVLGPSDSPFFRYDVEMRVSESGMETDAKWVPIR